MGNLGKRYDFVLVFDVQDGNPNGDPDAGNLPRVDSETGHGIVTDVCLKRKIRNYVQLTKGGKPPYDIYVKEKAVLGRAHVVAFKELGIDVGQEHRRGVTPELAAELVELTLPEGIACEEGSEGSELVVAADADKKAVAAWFKDNKPSKQVKDVINNALKEAKPRKPTAEETERGRQKMCADYFDIRTFGAVMSLRSAPNCGQVRGPVQLTFGRSVEPVVTLEHSITRMAVATEAEAAEQSGDNRTMGRKNTIPYGAYVAHGFVSPFLAAQTGFSLEDLGLLWEALQNMFDHDRSAARGLMSTCKLIVFEHENALGVAPARALFERVKITRKDVSLPPRGGFAKNYHVVVEQAGLAKGVQIMELV